jgi:hypothetical protein
MQIIRIFDETPTIHEDPEGGRTLLSTIGLWPTLGQFMRTRGLSGFDRRVIMKKTSKKPVAKGFAASVQPALRRAAKVARKTARVCGTPLYFWKNGRVVAEKP